MTDSDQTHIDEGQPLVSHLIELRSRLLRSILAVLVVFIPLFYFANDIYLYVSAPLRSFMPSGTTMIATEVASPFITPFKLTLVLEPCQSIWRIPRSTSAECDHNLRRRACGAVGRDS